MYDSSDDDIQDTVKETCLFEDLGWYEVVVVLVMVVYNVLVDIADVGSRNVSRRC